MSTLLNKKTTLWRYYRLSILPKNESLWAAAITIPWSDAQLSQEQYQINECPWQNPSPLDFHSHGRTELSYAAGDGHLVFTEQFLSEITIEVNSRDDSGQTPLSWAAGGGHEAAVRLLLEKGADPESKDNENGRTPLSWAARGGHEAVVRLLRSHRILSHPSHPTA